MEETGEIYWGEENYVEKMGGLETRRRSILGKVKVNARSSPIVEEDKGLTPLGERKTTQDKETKVLYRVRCE